MIWGQQTFPPDVVTFPPPPTMTAGNINLLKHAVILGCLIIHGDTNYYVMTYNHFHRHIAIIRILENSLLLLSLRIGM